MTLWGNYKQIVLRNCVDHSLEESHFLYWRNKLFAATVQLLIPLSLFAFIPGLYVAVITDMWLLLIADLLVVLAFIVIAFAPGLSVKFRKSLMTLSLYGVSVVLLYELGMYGPGMLYLLAITIFVTLIFEFRYALASVMANTLICSLFGLMIYLDWGSSYVVAEYDLEAWIALSSNLVFLCAVSLFLIPQLFNGLQQVFDQRNAVEQELKESLSRLEEKNEELEKFAYIASHDLKEPLRMVRNFMDLLQKKYGESLDEKARKYIHFAVDGAQRMTRLIDDLLEYSRIGRLHSDVSRIDLNELIKEITSDYFPDNEEGAAVITASDLPVIEAVEVSARMLFQNLISNALKYQHENRPLKISISYEDLQTHWKFSVTDNGIGIEEDYSERIFDIFKRLHTITEYSGTGIGLAICKKIVEQHGGKIWVESVAGEGSCFYFTIEKNPVQN